MADTYIQGTSETPCAEADQVTIAQTVEQLRHLVESYAVPGSEEQASLAQVVEGMRRVIETYAAPDLEETQLVTASRISEALRRAIEPYTAPAFEAAVNRLIDARLEEFKAQLGVIS